MVGHRHGRHLELYRAIDKVLDAAGTIENRVLGVTVEVDKLSGHGKRSYRPGRRRVLALSLVISFALGSGPYAKSISFALGSDPYAKLTNFVEVVNFA